MRQPHTMKTNWSLRAEFLTLSQRWPQIIVAFLMGGMIGWVVTFALPTDYRAMGELFVAVNADTVFRTPDDYKNWQLEQLETFAISSQILQGTLDTLKNTDSDWGEVTLNQLRNMLSVAWRNAGQWNLVVRTSDPEMARQAAQVWEQILLAELQDTLAHASEAYRLSQQINAISHQLLAVRERLQSLEEAQRALNSWLEAAQKANSASPLTERERWRLESLVGRVAPSNPGGITLMLDAPEQGSPVSAYIPWVQRAIPTGNAEAIALQKRDGTLRQKYERLNQRWMQADRAAKGLSINIHVEAFNDISPDPEPLRPTEWMTVVGGFIGVLAWVAYRLVQAR